MRYPSMIIFDYGHTLLYEPDFDSERGERALFRHIKSNPNGCTVEQINDFAQKIFEEIAPARKSGYELHEWQFQRFVYEYLGIELSLSQSEAENIFWDAMTPGALMPGADKMLDYLNAEGIRTGVISNISFSGDALRRRLDRLLPNNRFEFVITSSEYMFRKPSRLIFELALLKAQLSADDVWYCGDNPVADVEGAASIGIFPVWYDCDIDCPYRDRENEPSPTCGHLYIRKWDELIGALDSIKSEKVHQREEKTNTHPAMKFHWKDYTSDFSDTADSWTDDDVRRFTGLDEDEAAWNTFHEYCINNEAEGMKPGENYWCKVISDSDDIPFAVIAFSLYDGEVTIMEYIVDPERRGRGLGSSALGELLENGNTIIGRPINKAMAVIFPNNKASQRAFERAGFVFDRAHPDGDAWYYKYKAE